MIRGIDQQMNQPNSQRVARNRRPKQGNNRRTQNNGKSRSVNPKSKFDDYTSRALKATSSGDLIAAENFYQHAEHYYRMMNID